MTTGEYIYTTWYSYATQLKITGCLHGYEFTCDDGQCVKMEERCDQVADCRDKSDEKASKILMMELSYNKLIPPITTVSKTDKTIISASVIISIVLMKIVKMEETDHKIDMQFEVTLSWRENNRVQFHNLKQNTALNALPQQDVEQLWLPLVIYENTDQKETTRLGVEWEWSTSVTITRGEGDPQRISFAVVDEIEIFSGNKNTLTMNQTYTHQFQCKYDLGCYPARARSARSARSAGRF
jgi:hypothetical protein